MALTIDTETEKDIDFATYLEKIRQTVDFHDHSSVCASAVYLRQLANNRTLITSFLNEQLESWRMFQPDNMYTAQTFVLGSGKDFLVRMNIWAPRSADAGLADIDEKMFAFHTPHNHNFSFLTVGYHGSGYSTDLYEYDPDDTKCKGEPRFVDRTKLSQGKVMFYRAFRDVHDQDFADELSVSINLMAHVPEEVERKQVFFTFGNLKQRAREVNMHDDARTLICRLAARVGDGTTASLLQEIGSVHRSDHVRVQATEALAAMEKTYARDIWQATLRNCSPQLRRVALANLSRL